IWVEFANSQALAKKVLNYELDVAVTARENALPSFHSLAFTSDTLIVLAPKGSAWERRRSISVKELKRQVIVCREPGSSSRSAADRLIDTAGMPPEPCRADRQSRGCDSRGRGREGAWHYFRR